MGVPTKSEAWDQLTKRAKVYDALMDEFSGDYFTNEASADEALKGEHTSRVAVASRQLRSQLSKIYSGGRDVMLDHLRAVAKYGYDINPAGLDDNTLFDKIADAMNTASETIASREVTFGSISAGGSNASTGSVYRVTQDRNGDDLEGGQMGALKIETRQDMNTGGKQIIGNEQVEIFGNGIIKEDEVYIGETTNLRANMRFHRGNNGKLINSSFDLIQDSITTTNQTGWVLSATANFAKETSTIFRYTPGTESTQTPSGAALKMSDNLTFYQYVSQETFALSKFRDAPYILVARVMPINSADGTYTVRLGSQTTSALVSSLTANQWNDITIGVGATSEGWYDNFKENWVNTTGNIPNGVRVGAEWSGRTAGDLIWDEFVLMQTTKFNGTYWGLVSGSNTGATSNSGDTLIGDYWDVTDSFTTGGTAQGRTQEVLSRLFPGYSLPHTNGVETYADA